MAFTPNKYLRENTSVTLRDQQHAARLFTDDQFRLAPKHKFLFHVSFGINSAALRDIVLVQRHRTEINMLVKAIDLPNFSINTETLNQYNRKKNVQFKQTYTNASITFHDDNMGVINQLWQNYYNYYYADPSSAEDAGAYDRNATKNFSYFKNAYGLDNGSTLPFFNYITVYQMARHEYVSYKFINPIIASWNHNKLDYSQNSLHDNTMSFQYEAVAYGSGTIANDPPEGFALEHYDLVPSPLQPGTTTSTVGSASPSFADSTVLKNSAEAISNVTSAINTYQNTGQLLPNAKPGVISNLIQTATQGVTGLQGIAFPVPAASSPNVVQGTLIKLK